MPSYFDQHQEIYREYIDSINNISYDFVVSIYLRGSAGRNLEIKNYKPWDIDMVLLFKKKPNGYNLSLLENITQSFNEKIVKNNHPHIDKHIISTHYSVIDKFVLYNVQMNGMLISGEHSSLLEKPINLSASEVYFIYQYYLNLVVKKSEYLFRLDLKMVSCDFLVAKVNNLIKLISRCGCLLIFFYDGVFTRELTEGLKALSAYTSDESFLIIGDFINGQGILDIEAFKYVVTKLVNYIVV
ncbi:hypothetical protein [Thiothrix subterranea]|uniref:Uncharacterized protein n=1 Tax=Thiothrix subterranea TaxID=2735563 RepID=A0AA51MSV8_9GAMM|nr:hypothetical protein [Thiothrix subterranea]WML88736.1 hypothetical protein RCG00_10220 [Thiothrix subterranea]